MNIRVLMKVKAVVLVTGFVCLVALSAGASSEQTIRGVLVEALAYLRSAQVGSQVHASAEGPQEYPRRVYVVLEEVTTLPHVLLLPFQQPIGPEQAAQHVGQAVTLSGRALAWQSVKGMIPTSLEPLRPDTESMPEPMRMLIEREGGPLARLPSELEESRPPTEGAFVGTVIDLAHAPDVSPAPRLDAQEQPNHHVNLAVLEQDSGTLYFLLPDDKGWDSGKLASGLVNQEVEVIGTVYVRKPLAGIVARSVVPVACATPAE